MTQFITEHELRRADWHVRASRAPTILEALVKPCEYCGERLQARYWVHGMTAYHTDLPNEHIDNPNRSRWYCTFCAIAHIDYWTAMWDEYYYSSRG